VELETVTENAEDSSAAKELIDVVRVLGLDVFEVVSGSYGEIPASGN